MRNDHDHSEQTDQADHEIKEECKRTKKTAVIPCRRNPYVYRDSRTIFIQSICIRRFL